MPKGSDYFNFILINLLFIIQIGIIYYFISINGVKDNWVENRCNPAYMLFADNIQDNFNYCIQNTQMNYMGFLLQPLTFITSSLSTLGGELSNDINGVRAMLDNIRTFITNITEGIFGVFLNLIIEIQKMVISIKDLGGKIIGIVVIFLNVLSGAYLTIGSMWNGPPGQLVQRLGKFCFIPETKIKLKSGIIKNIETLQIGDILKNNSIVIGVIQLYNNNCNFYKFKEKGEDNNDIYITGYHYVQYNNNWIYVKNHPNAVIDNSKYSKILYNLITTTHTIPIGDMLFYDWEDDELNNNIMFHP